MKVIFVNWTKPFFERKNFMGYKKHSTYEYDGDDYFIPQHEIIMQIASITSAKTKTNFPLKLITDNIGKKYYEKMGIIDLFDEVDTETLESINNEFNINPAQFWTSGKIISICNENPPFIFMDLDLILKDELPNWIFNYDVVHTHWELSRSFLYIEKYMLDNLGLNIPTFNDRMLIPNTSFLFINNEPLLSEYLKLHLEITTRTYEVVPDWLWLMSDQHILGYSFRDMDLKVTSFSDMTYIQFPDTEEDKPGFLPEWIKIEQKFKETPINFEHVWLDKSKLINNPDYRTKKVSEWKSIINKNGYESKLLNIPDIYI